jgi:hypothetical protein
MRISFDTGPRFLLGFQSNVCTYNPTTDSIGDLNFATPITAGKTQ